MTVEELSWIQSGVRTPRYKGVVDGLAAHLRAGRWPVGTRLPTHRALAAREGIALVTATRVYAELEAMGLVTGEPGRGTFVRDTALLAGQGIDEQAVATDAVDLQFNYPAIPGQADLLRQALRDLATAGDLESLLHYQPHAGRPEDRAAIARHVLRRGLTVDAANVLIVSGAQHGLAATAMATLRRGDVVAVDPLTYTGFKVLAHTMGLELVATSDLDNLCRRRPVRAVYSMPTLHNPLGTVLSLTARKRLVATARRHGLLIIEDAAYAYLVEDAPPPLAALAPERTVYVSSLSKSVATGLRVGYVVAPEPQEIERVIRATTWNTPALNVALVRRWLADGTVDRWRPTSALMPICGRRSPVTSSTGCRTPATRRRTSSGCRSASRPGPTASRQPWPGNASPSPPPRSSPPLALCRRRCGWPSARCRCPTCAEP
jgi:DNA-binding transcriptional MocR family regulator